MSNAAQDTAGVIDELAQFYRDYYRDELGELAAAYPRDGRSLVVDWSDLHSAWPEFADDFRSKPNGALDRNPLRELHEALRMVDLPVSQDFTHDEYADAHVRVMLPPSERIGIGDVRNRHRGQYVAIEGQVERITSQTEYMTTGAFECQNCGSIYEEPQPRDEIQDPGTCPDNGCSGKPSWQVIPEQSDTVDLRMMKIKQPPEEASGSGKTLTVYLEDDLAFADGSRHGRRAGYSPRCSQAGPVEYTRSKYVADVRRLYGRPRAGV